MELCNGESEFWEWKSGMRVRDIQGNRRVVVQTGAMPFAATAEGVSEVKPDEIPDLSEPATVEIIKKQIEGVMGPIMTNIMPDECRVIFSRGNGVDYVSGKTYGEAIGKLALAVLG
jgi:hypothetical protein